MPTTSPRGAGRPPAAPAKDVATIAMQTFCTRGFEQTTMADIAREAGVSERTVYRYFGSKNDVFFWDFDDELERIRVALEARTPQEGVMDALRGAIVAANQFRGDEIETYRERVTLLRTVPSIQAAGAPRFARWRALVASFAAERWGMEADDLRIVTLSHAGLAAGDAAVDLWLASGRGDLAPYLDAAWVALASGFTEPACR